MTVGKNDNWQNFQVIGMSWKREVYMSDQTEALKTHLLSHLAPAITEKVLDSGVLTGLSNAIARQKKQWTPATNMTRYFVQQSF